MAQMNLNFGNNIFKLSISAIDKNLIRFDLNCINNKSNHYVKEFNLNEFKELNQIFRIYDTLEEIEKDLIKYIITKKFEVIQIKEEEAILKLTIISAKDNIINFILPNKSIYYTNKINELITELGEKDKRINSLENRLSENIKLINQLQEQIKNINTKVDNLQKINKDKKGNEENCKNYHILCKEKFEYLENFLQMNIPIEFKEIENLYDVYYFPSIKCKAYLFPYEIKIYDENDELFKIEKTYRKKCSLCSIDDHLIAFADGKHIKFISLLGESNYLTVKKVFQRFIYKIIKGYDENEIIVSDGYNTIKFLQRNEEKKTYIPIKNKTIFVPNPDSDDLNILLVNNILVAATDKLYFFDLTKINNKVKMKKKEDEENEDEDEENSDDNSLDSGDLDETKISSYKFKPNDYNSMTLLDKEQKIFAVSGTIPFLDNDENTKIEFGTKDKIDLSCSISFFGDVGVGVLSLITKIEKNIFNEFQEPSDLAHLMMNIKINNIGLMAHIKKINQNFILAEHSDIIILVYSINNEESFNYLKLSLSNLKKINPKAKFILVGNKTDLENERKISKEMGMKFKEENNLEAFIETSTKKDNIREVLFAEAIKCFCKNKEIFFPKACILEINDINDIKLIKYFYEKNTAISAICSSGEEIFLLGLENGDINAYETNKFEMKSMRKTHTNGIRFIKLDFNENLVSYGGDNLLKIWG